ncbi:MAG: MmgE/PrpD family protein [Burkholderiales bacterium]|nr:MmgE/PrpD family protein [Burkholderiales bacterium]
MNDRAEIGAGAAASGPSDLAGATRVLGRFVAELRYERLPEAVVARARLALLDWIGSAWAGVAADSARRLGQVMVELGGAPECTVVGERLRLPLLHAALLNGVEAAVYEVDDVHLDCRIHPGLPVISAAFALAEREGLGGRRLIEAIVAGYEVIVRTAIALGVKHNECWHSTGTAGAIGAAAAAAKLLGLNAEQCAGAIGLGATQGAGLIDGTEGQALAAKHLHGAKAAHNGILAALLARREFLGSRTALEGEWGFVRAFGRGTEGERRALLDRLGEHWYILRTISKPFACCLSAHAGIIALLDLVRRHDLGAERIESIEAYVPPSAYYMIKNPDPRDELQAKFSLPFCLAVAAVQRELGYRAFEDATLFDPKIRALMSRVSLETRDTIGRIETLVRVRTKSGEALEHLAVRESLDADGIVRKVRGLLLETMDSARVQAIVEAVSAVDDCADLRALGPIFSGPAGPSSGSATRMDNARR